MASVPLKPGGPATFTYPAGVLIGNVVKGSTAVPPYGNDNIPQPTQVDGVLVSALFELQSTTAGFLPPRMTTAQKNAIPVVSDALTVFDTTLNQLSINIGNVWTSIGGGNVSGPSPSTVNSLAVYGNVSGTSLLNTLVSLNPLTSIIAGIAQATSGAGTNLLPTYSFSGDANTGMYRISADNMGFAANNGINFGIAGLVASGTNYIQVSGNTTGFAPILEAISTVDANCGLSYKSKGASAHEFLTGGGRQFLISNTDTAVNYCFVQGAITNQPAIIGTGGTDASVDCRVNLKGNGNFYARNGIVLDSTVTAAPASNINQVYLNAANAGGGQGSTLAITGSSTLVTTPITDVTVTNKIPIQVNGVIYYLLSTTSNA